MAPGSVNSKPETGRLAVILSITTFPPIAIAAPIFKLWTDIGIYNTYQGLIIPYLTFALPSPAELIVSNPAIDWARQYLPAFRDVQSQKAPAHSLAAAAVASAPLEERFENPWFKAVENAVFLSLRNAIGAEVERARDAGKADRDKARALADGYLEIWKGMTAKLDAKFTERHRFLAEHDRQLLRLFDGFPMELADLDKIDPALDAAFAAESPDAELSKIAETLDGLESRLNLSRESRQRRGVGLPAEYMRPAARSTRRRRRHQRRHNRSP